MRAAIVLVCILVAVVPGAPAQSPREPSLDTVLGRISEYVAAYGAQASMFVGREAYTQKVAGATRLLVSEFAIVKAGAGENWVGYRDVTEVDGKAVADRQDRLQRLFSAASVTSAQLKQVDDESARYNIGPIGRNFNVPTTVLFFFDPATIKRFSFERKGALKMDGVLAWELEFTEKARPTLVRTPKGRDVKSSGRIWVNPENGTVLGTRIELKDFADSAGPRQAPPTRSPLPQGRTVDTTIPGVGVVSSAPAAAAPDQSTDKPIQNVAQIEVVYGLDARYGVWLPLKMSETYQSTRGAATGVAEYSDFKRFQTSARILTAK